MKKTILILLLALTCLILNATATHFVNIETTGPFVVANTAGYIDIYAELDGTLLPIIPNQQGQRIVLSYAPFYNSNPSWLSTVTTTYLGYNTYKIRLPYVANSTGVDREGTFRIDLQYYSQSEGAWSSYSPLISDTWFFDHIFQFRATASNPYQTAITNAANNSTVIIPAGVHVGHLTVNGKTNLTIKGAGITGTNVTTIQSAGYISAITITGCTNLKIQDMVITNGMSSKGGGINCSNSTVTVENCMIRNNTLRHTYSGGAIPPETKGGAIYLGEGQNACTVKSTIIYGNNAQEGKTAYVANGALNFDACSLLESTGGSNYVTWAGNFQIWNSIVSSADVGNSNFYYSCSYNPNVTLPGVNNIATTNPMFVNPATDNYALQKGSPCIGTGYKLLYDDPLVTGYDQNLRTMKDETQDIGAVNFAWDRYASYTFTDDPDANWMCYPVVDDYSTISIGGNTYTTDIMRAFFYQYETLNSPMISVSYKWYGPNGFGVYYHTPSDPSYDTMKRYLGYKALFSASSTMPLTGAIHGYQIPYTDPVPVPEPGTENWIGYFIPETQTPQMAFGSFMDELYFIQHKNWTLARLKPKRGTPWIGIINQGQPLPSLSYGDMVIVKKFGASEGYPEVEQFTWSRIGAAPTYMKEEAKNFTYIKEPSYKPIFVEVDSLSTAKELAVLINGVCYGASVVDGAIIMIQAYVESIPDGADIQIVGWDGAKSQATPLALQVYNRDADVFYPSASIIKEDYDFYYVKLGESESNTDTPPALTFAVSNYPNPFNPTTTIRYTVPKDGDVRLCIYNTRGQLITTLVNEHKNLGIHSVVWNGLDDNGNKVSSGLYFTRIVTDGKTLTAKMLMLK
jgi:hypothetical protein